MAREILVAVIRVWKQANEILWGGERKCKPTALIRHQRAVLGNNKGLHSPSSCGVFRLTIYASEDSV